MRMMIGALTVVTSLMTASPVLAQGATAASVELFEIIRVARCGCHHYRPQ